MSGNNNESEWSKFRKDVEAVVEQLRKSMEESSQSARGSDLRSEESRNDISWSSYDGRRCIPVPTTPSNNCSSFPVPSGSDNVGQTNKKAKLKTRSKRISTKASDGDFRKTGITVRSLLDAPKSTKKPQLPLAMLPLVPEKNVGGGRIGREREESNVQQKSEVPPDPAFGENGADWTWTANKNNTVSIDLDEAAKAKVVKVDSPEKMIREPGVACEEISREELNSLNKAQTADVTFILPDEFDENSADWRTIDTVSIDLDPASTNAQVVTVDSPETLILEPGTACEKIGREDLNSLGEVQTPDVPLILPDDFGRSVEDDSTAGNSLNATELSSRPLLADQMADLCGLGLNWRFQEVFIMRNDNTPMSMVGFIPFDDNGEPVVLEVVPLAESSVDQENPFKNNEETSSHTEIASTQSAKDNLTTENPNTTKIEATNPDSIISNLSNSSNATTSLNFEEPDFFDIEDVAELNENELIEEMAAFEQTSGKDERRQLVLTFHRSSGANAEVLPEVSPNQPTIPIRPTPRATAAAKDSSQKFVCEICKAAFAQNYKLKIHLSIHTGRTIYHCECENCGIPFRDYATMKRFHNRLNENDYESK